jgi:NDP-sugar pyrophosphorylase family protein
MRNIPEITVGILAGGYGERMGYLSTGTQKCLLPVDNKPVLLHVIESLHHAFGSFRLVLALAHRADEVQEVVKNNLPIGVTAEYCFDKNNGTKIAYKNILDSVSNDTILFTSGDAIIKPSVYKNLFDLAINYNEPTLAGSIHINEAITHPLIKTRNNKIISYRWPVNETSTIDPEENRDMCVIVSKRINLLNLIENCPNHSDIAGVFQDAMNKGIEINSFSFSENWLHMAYPQDLQKHWVI